MINKSNDFEKFIKSDLNENYLNTYLPRTLNHETNIIKTDQGLKFKCEFQISTKYKADNFRLKLINNLLVVEADLKEFVNRLNSNLNESENFRREIQIPDFVNKETLSCFFETYKDKNLLVIEAYLNSDSTDDIKKNTKTNQCLIKSNGYLKYKFDLSDYEPKNISISVRNKSILVINAYKKIYDYNGKPVLQEFNHEIKLPDQVEFHNIKNCFDEYDGVLRVEIPIPEKDLDEAAIRKQANMSGEKYLELMFELAEFKFDGYRVFKNFDNKKVLEVRAVKEVNNGSLSLKPNIRKYVLPDWVNSDSINVVQEKQNVNNQAKNFLILQLPIID